MELYVVTDTDSVESSLRRSCPPPIRPPLDSVSCPPLHTYCVLALPASVYLGKGVTCFNLVDTRVLGRIEAAALPAVRLPEEVAAPEAGDGAVFVPPKPYTIYLSYQKPKLGCVKSEFGGQLT